MLSAMPHGAFNAPWLARRATLRPPVVKISTKPRPCPAISYARRPSADRPILADEDELGGRARGGVRDDKPGATIEDEAGRRRVGTWDRDDQRNDRSIVLIDRRKGGAVCGDPKRAGRAEIQPPG